MGQSALGQPTVIWLRIRGAPQWIPCNQWGNVSPEGLFARAHVATSVPPDAGDGRESQQIYPNTAEYEQLISDTGSALEEIRTGIGGVFWLDELDEMTRGQSQECHRRDIWAWPTEASSLTKI
jgi:hypothetical protein